ncbi:hypothetical protein HPO96_09980 [Kribbella sandramycini]|uniref:Uncharacterized protein n=1 Tax=Kribbella sandramycini TaxID=60450 RepID=A0A7Y4KZ29_9ACTN|nr:hypothetical protein [Kribbella sandramycini]MBB6569594.1 hypothetical protein [Kribbella sandramycini]NOL40572.1 hypothetical protein [Kribbella sandramycini]
MRRQLVPTVVTGAAVLGVVAFSLVAGAPVGNAAARPSSAYAVSGEGQLPINKTPYVESADGKRVSSSALELPSNPLLDVRAGTVTAGNNSASVELIDLSIGAGALGQIPIPPDLKKQCDTLPPTGAGDLPIPDLALPDLGLPLPPLSLKDLPVKNLPDLCKLLLTPPTSLVALDAVNVWCSAGKGGVDIGSLTLLGQKLSIPTTSQSFSTPANPLISLAVNQQTKNADGSFTITALTVNLGNGAQILKFASATCAKPVVHKPTPKPTTPKPTPPVHQPPAAPQPTPVKTHLPVTG